MWLVTLDFVKKNKKLFPLYDENPYLTFYTTVGRTDLRRIDLYKFMQLESQRMRASQEDIETKYRELVRTLHPDKLISNGRFHERQCNEIYNCLKFAYAVLSNPVRRRAFDSVDPTFNEWIPAESVNKERFFTVLGSLFYENSRFSRKRPVPLLGSMESSPEHVAKFYRFWLAFDSWRTFEHLDCEDEGRIASRQEKRAAEKRNQAQREKLKQEDNERIRRLVKLAYDCDPRIEKAQPEKKVAELDNWESSDVSLVTKLVRAKKSGVALVAEFNRSAQKKRTLQELLSAVKSLKL